MDHDVEMASGEVTNLGDATALASGPSTSGSHKHDNSSSDGHSASALGAVTTAPAVAGPSSGPSTTLKPRSKAHKPARSPSPTPPPPPAPAPLQTIRLQIRLGGPDNYAVDIAEIARATGQRPPTPLPVRIEESDDDGGGEGEGDGKGDGGETGKKKLKKKKKNPTYEHYDISDPFIDDSELAIDERTYFAQTKQTGFYVSSGEVALLKDKTPKKAPPKSKLNQLRPSLTAASRKASGAAGATSISAPPGTRDHPVAVPLGSASETEDNKKDTGPETYTVGDPRVGEKRKRYVTVVEGGKKRKIVDVHSFHPLIQDEVAKLREAIEKESWDHKGKFPPVLKPLLSSLAILAIRLDEYDDHFFNLMPTLFPYNKFTMSKLIKRTVFQDHTALLMERQDALLAELAAQAKEGFAKAEEEWERAVLAWDKRQEKLRLEAPSGAGTDSATPTRHPTEEAEMDVEPSPSAAGDKEVNANAKDKDANKDTKDKDGKEAHLQQPPGKKYRLTDSMKAIIWQLVLLSNECCRLENEKNTLEGSVMLVSEQGLRKVLYQKIVAAFPEGWLSSGQISRDVSAMKKRFEKEAMEQEQEQQHGF